MQECRSALPILARWEAFIQEHPEGTHQEFARWLLQSERAADPAEEVPIFNRRVKEVMQQRTDERQFLNTHVSKNILRLNKFILMYAKDALGDFALSSLDDFGFLSALAHLKSTTKKELSLYMLVGVTTGQDIIKRLIQEGLVKERVNPEDRRAKLISVTARGQKLLGAYYQKLSELPDLLVDLDLTAQRTLVAQLEMLDNYHTRQYEARKGIT